MTSRWAANTSGKRPAGVLHDLVTLEHQAPQWIWLTVSASLVVLALALGNAWMIVPACSALVISGVGLIGARLGFWMEAAIFVSLTTTVQLAWKSFAPIPRSSIPELNAVLAAPRKYPRELVKTAEASLLVGRIGLTHTNFINGAGLVLIDGREWPADLDGGEDRLPTDVLVRVIRVNSGPRLLVQGLHT